MIERLHRNMGIKTDPTKKFLIKKKRETWQFQASFPDRKSQHRECGIQVGTAHQEDVNFVLFCVGVCVLVVSRKQEAL